MNFNSQRGSPSKYRMRGLRFSTFTRRVTLLLEVLSSPEIGSTPISRDFGPASPQLKTRVSLCNWPSDLSVTSCEASTLPLSRTLSLALLPESP